ncbi:MAG: 16S rRNA (cytosine(967)-C(5))-methyltransferase RsmB, partial [Calditrichaeota bacterium]|nr:16S rRNA (cytosine(967)-C(5))-methyltransferase RsmB [Calditrichota bacterium]
MPQPREAAVELYAKWLEQKFRLDNAVTNELNKCDWESRDKALFQELLYGVIRLRRRLDWIFRSLSSSDIGTDHVVIATVTIALYQILYLDRIPDHAAVNSAVNLVRKHSGLGVSRWINAVLREAGRQREALQDKELNCGDENLCLGVSYSYPDWMVKRWRKRFSLEQLREFLNWNNRRPFTYLRVNRLRSDSETVLKNLKQRGIDSEVSPIDRNFLLLRRISNPGSLEILRTGIASVQDISQGLVALLLKPESGEVVLDLCAAPGGKTGHLAELNSECKIIATDDSKQRLTLVRENVNRCGYANVEVIEYKEALSKKRQFDAVLVDAPCTGTGVMSRRPDLRWWKTADDAVEMAKIQIELLQAADKLLKPGGRIIYSTCSIEETENEGVVNKFLARNSDYTQIDAGSFI